MPKTNGSDKRSLSDVMFDLIFDRTNDEARNWKKALKEGKWEISRTSFIALGVALIIEGIDAFGLNLYQKSSEALGKHITQTTIATLVCLAGFGAHWAKKINQLRYGIVEIVFGIFSAYAIAWNLPPNELDFARLASLLGAAYVIVRGISNVSEARSKLRTSTRTSAALHTPTSNISVGR